MIFSLSNFRESDEAKIVSYQKFAESSRKMSKKNIQFLLFNLTIGSKRIEAYLTVDGRSRMRSEIEEVLNSNYWPSSFRV